MRFLKDLKPAAFAAAPLTAAILTLAVGVMLLASGATPSEPVRFMRLIQFTPVYLIEASHFLSSIAGLALVMLAFGLRARLDAAWAATMSVLLLAATLALLKGFNWEETAMLLGVAVLLAPFRGAFPRASTPPGRRP
jgi:phosphatidylglycerol lysyltransferase